jgi:hypothetical protein
VTWQAVGVVHSIEGSGRTREWWWCQWWEWGGGTEEGSQSCHVMLCLAVHTSILDTEKEEKQLISSQEQQTNKKKHT